MLFEKTENLKKSMNLLFILSSWVLTKKFNDGFKASCKTLISYQFKHCLHLCFVDKAQAKIFG